MNDKAPRRYLVFFGSGFSAFLGVLLGLQAIRFLLAANVTCRGAGAKDKLRYLTAAMPAACAASTAVSMALVTASGAAAPFTVRTMEGP